MRCQGLNALLVHICQCAQEAQCATEKNDAHVDILAAFHTRHQAYERVVIGVARVHAGPPPQTEMNAPGDQLSIQHTRHDAPQYWQNLYHPRARNREWPGRLPQVWKPTAYLLSAHLPRPVHLQPEARYGF